MENNNKLKNILTKTLFLIGIILIILVLAFAVIKIIPKIFSAFNESELFKPKDELGLVIDNTSLTSGRISLIEWEYEPSEGGNYEFSYACSNYLKLQLGTTDGNKDIKCDTVYRLNPTTQKISILPTLEKENVLVNLPISIKYVNQFSEALVSDDAELTVVRRSGDELAGSATIIGSEVINPAPLNNNDSQDTDDDTVTTQTTTTSTPTQTTPVYRGKPDLKISNLRATNDVTVVFDISNIGTNTSSNWVFNYRMPDGDVGTSPLQNGLRPGEAIRFTLRFEDIPSGEVVIAVDPSNLISESSDLNNIAVIEIDGDDGYSNNDNDYNRNDDADLTIEDFEVGKLSSSRFSEDDEIDEDDNAAVRFTVKNIGGESTGSWRFEISNTPYSDDDTYESARQSSLQPGESRVIIVEFENPNEGRYPIEVEVDSDDEVDEEDERNNDDSETLEVTN